MANGESSSEGGIPIRTLYGPAIYASMAKGDVKLMKELAAEAESQLKRYGDVRSALAVLKAEIAKAEARKA